MHQHSRIDVKLPLQKAGFGKNQLNCSQAAISLLLGHYMIILKGYPIIYHILICVEHFLQISEVEKQN